LLGDAVVATVAGLLLFLTVLTLMAHTVHLYSQARNIREATMVGRMYMEKMRQHRKAAPAKTINLLNRSYAVQLEVTPVNDRYEIHTIEVTDSDGAAHTFKRLEKISSS
jgi:hypothetical protein